MLLVCSSVVGKVGMASSAGLVRAPLVTKVPERGLRAFEASGARGDRYADGMKVIAFVVSIVIFLGSFLLFGYAFAVGPGWNYLLFALGLGAISLSLAIPFHLLEKLD